MYLAFINYIAVQVFRARFRNTFRDLADRFIHYPKDKFVFRHKCTYTADGEVKYANESKSLSRIESDLLINEQPAVKLCDK